MENIISKELMTYKTTMEVITLSLVLEAVNMKEVSQEIDLGVKCVEN